MSASYAEEYAKIVANGIVDEAYPVDRLCVHLPNGWYGINAILGGLAKHLMELGYDEEMVPSVSTNQIFSQIPESFQGDIVDTILKITHTGLHKLDDPFFMAARPDLIIPQIEMNYARSYRNLPVRRISGGYRYITSDSKESYALITDTEIPAKDFVGIFYTEEEYNAEIHKLLDAFNLYVNQKMHLHTFSVRRHHTICIFSIFPNGQVLEIATLRLYDRALAEAIHFTVLGPDNLQTPPFIFNFNVTSRAFAAALIAHSDLEHVVIPAFALRAACVAFNLDDKLALDSVDYIKKDFTEERWTRFKREGARFALRKGESGIVVTCCCGKSEEMPAEKVPAYVAEMLAVQEAKIAENEAARYAELEKTALTFSETEEAPEGKACLGQLLGEGKLLPEGGKFVVATLLVPIHH